MPAKSQQTLVGIIDNDIGNLHSVKSAVLMSGFDAEIVSTPDRVDSFSHLILPGVGSFHRAMQRLYRTGMASAIRTFADSGRPVLGICLGMHLLADSGNEGGEHEGLGLIPGRVRDFRANGLLVPHVGWNTVRFIREHPVSNGVKPDRDFYFVHSYVFDCENEAVSLAQSSYGENFCSIAAQDNTIGIQFHPEKSQANGLRLIENFCAWDGKC